MILVHSVDIHLIIGYLLKIIDLWVSCILRLVYDDVLGLLLKNVLRTLIWEK